MNRKGGIFLVLMSGLLTLLGLVGVALLRMSHIAGSVAHRQSARSEGRLAAESGLHYASSRLWRDPLSTADRGEILLPSNAADDWAVRGGEGIVPRPGRLQNPSYSHGESWADRSLPGGWPGAYDPNVDDLTDWRDLDGNGRFSAWTSRLRGEGAPRFSLRVQPADALVSVNGGELGWPLGDHDLDGVLNRDDPDFATDRDGVSGNGVPDWRDPDWRGNRHLVNLFDNLGAVVGASDVQAVPYAPGYPQLGTVTRSGIGRRIVSARPRGGYASLEEVRQVLGDADFGSVGPYLSVNWTNIPIALACGQGGIAQLTWASCVRSFPHHAYESHAPINFNHAPVEILKASLRHITASGSLSSFTAKEFPFIRLGEQEADALAGVLARLRPIHTWPDFLTALSARCHPHFMDDPFTTNGVDESSDPDRILLKEDLILAQVMPDGYFGDVQTRRLNALGVARETSQRGCDLLAARRILKEALYCDSLSTVPYQANGSVGASGISGIPCRATTEYDLAGGTHAAVGILCDAWSAGGAAASETDVTLLLGEVFRMDGQQDMEMFSSFYRPVNPGNPWRYEGGDIFSDGTVPAAKSRLETYPLFPVDSWDGWILPVGPSVTGPGAPVWAEPYPSTIGGIRLQIRPLEEIDPPLEPSCVFSQPFNPDPPWLSNNRWYDADDGWDNLGDPVGSPSAHRSEDPDGGGVGYSVTVCSGFRMGTAGPRFLGEWASGVDFRFKWKVGNPCLLPVWDSNGTVGLKDTTISFWCPVSDERLDLSTGPFDVALLGINMLFSTYPTGLQHLELRLRQGGLRLIEPPSTLGGGGNIVFDNVPVFQASPQGSPDCWRHIALNFNAVGGISLYLDGVQHGGVVRPWGVFSGGNNALFEGITLTWRGPLDDIQFFTPRLNPAEILQLARRDRYVASGSFRSTRFTVDPERHPEGIRLTGASWDAFLPSGINGAIMIDILAYDGQGNWLNPADTDPGRKIPWDGTGAPQASFSLAGCRAFEIGVAMSANAAPLHDSPHLRAVQLRYGAPSFSWGDVRGR